MMFFRYGLKSVTMDDVARELGISKKTLYQFFPTKNDLIQQTILAHTDCEKKIFADLRTKSKDAIEEILAFAKCCIKMLSNLSPTLMYDLQKFYPESWQLVEYLQKEHTYMDISLNMARGKEEGLYRKDVDTAVVARLYVAQSLCIVDETTFPQKEFAKEKLLMEFVLYHLRGVSTPRGLEKLAVHLGSWDKLESGNIWTNWLEWGKWENT